MKNALFKRLIRDAAWRIKRKSLETMLPSRCRKDGAPENGRFTRLDIQRLVREAASQIKELSPHVGDQENLGNYQNLYAGCLDLAIYRAMKAAGIGKDYACRLVADAMWQAAYSHQGLIPVIDPLRKRLLRLTTPDPTAYLGKRLRQMMKYPYGTPGYKIEYSRKGQVFHMDIHTCPVNDFFRQFGDEEMGMFRRTWCTFDFTAAEHVVEGGRYEREHALSYGDSVCAMRWYVRQ